ncbi:MAG: hypothetical protein HQM13_22740 [SAR324 cluster bacterium]|nr:hypothetical protein [SAR324 cluster bacterium]
MAQNLAVLQGEATVPVLSENLVLAEENAIFLAKQSILKDLLSQSIAPQILKQAQKLIDANILEKPDRFIESIRLIDSKESTDLSQFSVLLEARIFQSKLISVLRGLNIALPSDPVRHVNMFYNAKAPFWGNAQKKNTLLTLNRLLSPYRIVIGKTMPLASEWWESLKNKPNQALPAELLVRKKNSTFLVMDFDQGRLEKKKQKKELSIILTLKLYEASTGQFLTETRVSGIFKNRQQRQGMTQLLEKISLNWNPLVSALIETDQKSGSRIMVKLSGFKTPLQESEFIKTVFKSNGLRQFFIYKIVKDYVVYQAVYSGNRETLLSQLKKTEHPNFKINNLQWQKNQLEIEVQWTEKPTPLESYLPIQPVEDWIETHRIPDPQKKVPSDRIKTTYELPESTAVYDFLRSRGDSTSFKIDWAQPGDSLAGTWQKIDRTRMNPILSIFDAQGNLVEQHSPEREGGIHFEYQLPQNETHFYIRISDQIGYIEGESGSYLSLHYVLKIDSRKRQP